MENGDVIKAELYPEIAPVSVNNFISLIQKKFYDGLIFHRVIKGFMIQGGGMTMKMEEKPTHEPIANEAANGLKNVRGAVAMARTPDPHSATAQFFINTVDNAFLDHTAPTEEGYGYCVFGQVTDGMDVVDKIEKVKTRNMGIHSDVPTDMVLITSAGLFE